jgi:MFS family permease
MRRHIAYAKYVIRHKRGEVRMLNWIAKFLLVSTSLAPVLGAVAVNQLALERPWHSWVPWLGAAILLALICWLMLRFSTKSIQRDRIEIKEFERSDKEVLAFLLAYLLPFLSSKDMALTGQWITGAYIIVIIFWVVAHAGAFHFNPVMGLLGYHFYAVKDNHGASFLLISRKQLNRREPNIKAVKLAHDIYLYTGGADE